FWGWAASGQKRHEGMPPGRQIDADIGPPALDALAPCAGYCSRLSRDRPTADPSQEGSRHSSAYYQFPSWEGLGVSYSPNAGAKTRESATHSVHPTVVLSKQPQHRLGLDQFARLVEVIVSDRVRVDPQRVIDCRQNLRRMHGVFRRR